MCTHIYYLVVGKKVFPVALVWIGENATAGAGFFTVTDLYVDCVIQFYLI